jgi:hypothetical protein
MKHIETEIIINAKPEKVWAVLTDFEKYPTWNPFIKSIEGEKAAGKQLKVFIQPPNGGGMTFKPMVLTYDATKEFRWKGKLGISGIFDGEHYFRLIDMGENTTRFIHGERFSGILVPFMGGALSKTKEGFQLMNEALKRECEKV